MAGFCTSCALLLGMKGSRLVEEASVGRSILTVLDVSDRCSSPPKISIAVAPEMGNREDHQQAGGASQ